MNQENKIPEYLSNILSSPEIYSAIGKIETALGLHIDQSGELYVLISEIILGQEKSSNFINQVIQRLQVSKDLANKIAEETNKNIFEVVKNKLQTQNNIEETKSTIASLEQLGGFNIEVTPYENENKTTPPDRNSILNSLENPPKNPDHNFSEPLVDHLLSTAAGQEEKKVVTEPTPAISGEHKGTVPPNLPTDSEQPKKPEVRKGPDPYREPIQ